MWGHLRRRRSHHGHRTASRQDSLQQPRGRLCDVEGSPRRLVAPPPRGFTTPIANAVPTRQAQRAPWALSKADAQAVPGADESDVTLVGGETLTLEDATDVDDLNAGVLVISDDEKTYVAWDDVDRIDFEG